MTSFGSLRRRWACCGLALTVLLLSAPTGGGWMPARAMDTRSNAGSTGWQGTARMAAMPGCDFGVYTQRTGVTWQITASSRVDDQGVLSIVIPPISAKGGRIGLMLSGAIMGRLDSDRDFDALQDVTISCAGQVRKDKIEYRGRLTREGRKSTLKLEAHVTPCSGDSCSVSVVVKLTALPDAPP